MKKQKLVPAQIMAIVVESKESVNLKNIHPIIREYLNTGEDRDVIINKYANKNQYLESVLLRLNSELKLENEISKNLSDAIDKAIITGHPDSNLFVLFIATVISYYSRNFHLEKANSLCSIVNSMLSEEIHPIIKANFIQRKSAIKLREGNIKESMQLMKESLLLLDKFHPRYYIFSYNSSAFTASMGQ